MFVSDALVFLELQKTGCTHIAKLMSQVIPGKQIGKHNRPTKDLLNSQCPMVGSIRNPWDWYISLWAYGCGGNGTLYHSVALHWPVLVRLLRNPVYTISMLPHEFKKPARRWRRTYQSPDQPQLFREWLHLMLDPARKYDLLEGYADTPISSYAGLLTYRYIFLFSRNAREMFTRPEAVQSLADLQAFDRQNNLLDHVIRNEALEDDLIQTLTACGVQLTDAQIQTIRQSGRTNASSRKRTLDYYYDQETLELVRSREQFIIDKHGYTTPTLSS
jgi:hypothetical protein